MLTQWAEKSGQYIVVLGKLSLYERGGFSAQRAGNLTSPYPVSHTMLAGPKDDAPGREPDVSPSPSPSWSKRDCVCLGPTRARP